MDADFPEEAEVKESKPRKPKTPKKQGGFLGIFKNG